MIYGWIIGGLAALDLGVKSVVELSLIHISEPTRH